MFHLLLLIVVFKVLEVVHELLRGGRRATQRDLYYKVCISTDTHVLGTAMKR